MHYRAYLHRKSETCIEKVFDWENAKENEWAWNQWGSELAGDFGTKPCGAPTVWGQEYCEQHKKERRGTGGDRRKKVVTVLKVSG